MLHKAYHSRDEDLHCYSCSESHGTDGSFVEYALFVRLHAVTMFHYLILMPLFDILGGPIGPITFTAMSTSSINIQVDKGSEVGEYTTFNVVMKQRICEIPINWVLTECTDSHASQGRNNYKIGATRVGGMLFPQDYYASTLQEDRMNFLPFS